MSYGKLLLFCFFIVVHNVNANSENRVSQKFRSTIEKTFDSGTLIEHKIIIARDNQPMVAVRFSQRRKAEGNDEIVGAFLKYEPSSNIGYLTIDEQNQCLIEIFNILRKKFGTDLKIESLISSQYLGVKETEKKAILAFADFNHWQQYLKDKDRYSQYEIYGLIRKRINEKKVFSEIIEVFRKLGYSAEFSGFEKLFIKSAGGCDFYPELEKLGIKKDDKFPYPGIIDFSIKLK